MNFKTKIKAQASKLKFAFGKSPIIDSIENYADYIPKPYKTVVIISADFELAWAWQWSKQKDALDLAIQKSKNTRVNFPKLMELCERYNIPITWATVGHLFLESCSSHKNLAQLANFENDYWRYDKPDWFMNDPCSNYKDAPYWYAPDLIKQIIESPVEHEIGCHTFSHIDCRDSVCSPEVFNSEINACKKEAENLNLQLKSFVHPAHTIGNLDNLAKLGFTNFRTNNRNVLTYPKKHSNGLWEFEQTAEFVYRKEWSIDYHIYRYKKIIDRAIKSNTVCYFWFHPSFDAEMVNNILPEVFKYLDSKRDEALIISSGNYIDYLNENDR